MDCRGLCMYAAEKGAAYSSVSSVDFQRFTRHHIQKDRTLHNHRSENLKSYTESEVVVRQSPPGEGVGGGGAPFVRSRRVATRRDNVEDLSPAIVNYNYKVCELVKRL
jgi:hypothetical protein